MQCCPKESEQFNKNSKTKIRKTDQNDNVRIKQCGLKKCFGIKKES